MADSIHPATAIGAVHLAVRDLERALAFYRERLGFAVQRREGNVAQLGAGGAALVVLVEEPDARTVRGTTGLYHFAVLLPSRPALAEVLRHLGRKNTPLHGASDHRVSEALYLADPEGNGIEIYRDRPRAEWPREGSRIAMATDALDVDDLLAEPVPVPASAGGDGALPPGTLIGHVHLRVADIAAAEAFYCDVLGFDLTTRYGPSASFVSAGGYHHHIGFNTWAGQGAPPPPPDATGLRHFEVRLPDEAARERVVERLRAAGAATSRVPTGLLVRDPSRNGILLTVAELTRGSSPASS